MGSCCVHRNTSLCVHSCSFLPRWDWPTVRHCELHKGSQTSHRKSLGPWRCASLHSMLLMLILFVCLFGLGLGGRCCFVLFVYISSRNVLGDAYGFYFFKSHHVRNIYFSKSIWLVMGGVKERSHDKRVLLGWGAVFWLSGGRRWAERWGSYPTRRANCRVLMNPAAQF